TQNLTAGGDAVAQVLTEVVAENQQVPRPVCCKKSKKGKTTSDELRKMSLSYQLRGIMLSYLLSTRQELELIEANNKMKVIDDNLGSIEKEYSATKAKLEKDIQELKAEYERKLEQLVKDKEEKWARDRKTFIDEIAHLRAEAAMHKDQLASLLKEKNE
ncbi:hypothetical protein A2U01_0042021, partial [Trifolium medium]|nr:hypothetical protein [Trifolium medium]